MYMLHDVHVELQSAAKPRMLEDASTGGLFGVALSHLENGERAANDLKNHQSRDGHGLRDLQTCYIYIYTVYVLYS